MRNVLLKLQLVPQGLWLVSACNGWLELMKCYQILSCSACRLKPEGLKVGFVCMNGQIVAEILSWRCINEKSLAILPECNLP